MADSSKRKARSGGDKDAQDKRDAKRSKGGSGGKWQTPHQKEKAVSRGSGKVEPGDSGIWATCARGQEGRATEELKGMFEECAERFYGISSEPDADGEDASIDDIEASIRKEVASMGNRNAPTKLFSPVVLDLQCVLFFKTKAPIDPVDFVYKICEEIVAKPGIRRMKYANRLTPMSASARALEKGLDEVGRMLLGQHFNLASKEGEIENEKKKPSCSYAIRPTIRNHSSLTRDVVIKQTAEMIDDIHPVNLTTPDKTIILEIYQTVCGMSVVGDDWDKLKRFNLAELYSFHKKESQSNADGDGDGNGKDADVSKRKKGAKPESVKTDEVVRL